MVCLHKVNGVSIIPFFTKYSLADECRNPFFIFLSPACLVEMKCKRVILRRPFLFISHKRVIIVFFTTGSKPEYGLQVCKVIAL